MYGNNCSMRCGHCLESEKCHHINGTCINGCDSGYEGSICMEGRLCWTILWNQILKIPSINVIININVSVYVECKANYFGPNCIEMCNSTCKSCNRTTGICDLGCHPGWKGLFCHESMVINMLF